VCVYEWVYTKMVWNKRIHKFLMRLTVGAPSKV